MDDSLDLLLADGVIDEVLGRLKSGKEANIHLVRRRGEVIAAKVYKDRHQRSFKNNADYKEGRKTRNSRTQRAIEGGGRFGREAAEQAWKSTESDALSQLFARDVRVPRPVMFYEGVLLMELVLDLDGRPAPRLIDVAPDLRQASALYLDLRTQIVRMLCCEIIHGDLSPYNILAGAAGPTIIDFPQIVSAAASSRAEFFFQRDYQNVLGYVADADRSLAARHAGDARAIWRAYAQRELTPDYVPPPPPPPRPPRRDDRRFDDRGGRGEPRRDDRRPDDRRPAPARRPDDRGPAPARRPDDRGPAPARRPDDRGPAPARRPDDRGPAPARRPDDRGPAPARRPDDRGPAPARRPDDRGPAPARRPDDRGPAPARRPDDRGPAPARRPDDAPQRSFGPDRPAARPPPARPPPPSGGHRRRPKRRW